MLGYIAHIQVKKKAISGLSIIPNLKLLFFFLPFSYRLLRMLVNTPPFDRNRNHKNDTPALVERLWHLMK